jgi:hypothetical protein
MLSGATQGKTAIMNFMNNGVSVKVDRRWII